MEAATLREAGLRALEAVPTREIVDEVSGDPSRATRAPQRPAQRIRADIFQAERKARLLEIAFDDGEVGVLAEAEKAQRQAEAIRERELFLQRLAQMNESLKEQMALMDRSAAVLSEREQRIKELREENEQLRARLKDPGHQP